MSRADKLNAVRARWQRQQRQLESRLAIASEALQDLDARCAQLEQLQQDYRRRRIGESGTDTVSDVALLATLARFDVDISKTLASALEQREPVRAEVIARGEAVRVGQRKLLGLQRYQDSLREERRTQSRRVARRRQNQVPWRGGSDAAP